MPVLKCNVGKRPWFAKDAKWRDQCIVLSSGPVVSADCGGGQPSRDEWLQDLSGWWGPGTVTKGQYSGDTLRFACTGANIGCWWSHAALFVKVMLSCPTHTISLTHHWCTLDWLSITIKRHRVVTVVCPLPWRYVLLTLNEVKSGIWIWIWNLFFRATRHISSCQLKRHLMFTSLSVFQITGDPQVTTQYVDLPTNQPFRLGAADDLDVSQVISISPQDSSTHVSLRSCWRKNATRDSFS